MQLLISSLAVLGLGALAFTMIARALKHRKLEFMANAGSVVGPESHATGKIPFFADQAFLTQVAAHQTSGYMFNGRYLLVKPTTDEDTVTSTTSAGEGGVFGVCFDEPDSLSTTAPRQFTIAILGCYNGTMPVAVGGTVGPTAALNYGRVIANTDGTAVMLPIDGANKPGTYYVIGKVRRTHVVGDIAEVYHCVPYAVTVSA